MPIEQSSISKNIHFIWLGGSIPEKYLRNIQKLSKVAAKSDFKVNLWVDNEKNYHKSSIQHDTNIPNLHVRNISELTEKINNDRFYQTDNRARKFFACLNREMVGFKNFGAASDLLRYEILRQEGGYYFDTDTEFRTDLNSKLIVDKAPLGIKTFIRVRQSFNNKLECSGGNDIICCNSDHPVIENTLENAFSAYDKLDKETLDSIDLQIIKDMINYDLSKSCSRMDAKRFPYTKRDLNVYAHRSQDTIYSSGPGILSKSLKKFWESQPDQSPELLESLMFNTKVANVRITSNSDHVWLLNPEKPRWFDTSTIPDYLFFSKSAKKGQQARKHDIEKTREEENKPKKPRGLGELT